MSTGARTAEAAVFHRPIAARRPSSASPPPPWISVAATVAASVPPPFDAKARVPRCPAALRPTGPSGARLGRGQARAQSVPSAAIGRGHHRRRKRGTAPRQTGGAAGHRHDDRPGAETTRRQGTRKGNRRWHGRRHRGRRTGDGGREGLHVDA